ncbi:hypothetical protein F5Y05DRAFT_378255 [Hypoxylon sp. FL0543]|nr:hypothetical protein F5Y05DRAFT_378255 [Hypoxylon sp. FL0543]
MLDCVAQASAATFGTSSSSGTRIHTYITHKSFFRPFSGSIIKIFPSNRRDIVDLCTLRALSTASRSSRRPERIHHPGMADLERDLVDRDLRSSIDDNIAALLPSTSHDSYYPSIDSGGRSYEEDDITLVQSAALDVPAYSRERILQEQVSLLAIETSTQVVDGELHQPAPSSKDKGKAPVRVGNDSSDRMHPADAEISDGDLHSSIHSANNLSATENWETPKPHAASSTDITDWRSCNDLSFENNLHSEVRPASPETSSENPSVGSEDGHHGTTLSNGKQKQKQEVELEPPPEPRPVMPALGLQNGGGTGAQAFRPLQYGEPGWEKSADRPPKKLPIRFKDAVGRKFIFPWEKANTWASMERLIRSCFAHVAVIGPHVDEGHYDLLSYLPFSTPEAGFGTPFQAEPQNSSSAAPPAGAVEPPIDGASDEPPILQAPTPPPAAPSTPVQQQSLVVILPELWEDLIEPGIFVSMHMWPMNHPPLPPPPPPPPHSANPLLAPGFTGGRGRGTGRGVVIGAALPQRPPTWIVVEAQKPRGKTRKRREGPTRIG